MAVYFLGLILLFFFSDFAAQQSIVLSWPHEAQLSNCLPEQWHLSQLTYVSDIPFSKTEFLYLMGVQDNTLVTRLAFAQGLYALHKKGIFEEIKLDIVSQDTTYAITVCLKGAWTIGAIKSGSSTLIQQYTRYYDLIVGECFDSSKHAQALEKIKQQAYKHGYCNAQIDSTLLSDEGAKSVTVHLNIQLGALFRVDDCIVFLADQFMSDKLNTSFISTIEDALNKKWKSTSYRSKIDQLSKDYIAQLLAKEGFFNPDIEIIPMMDHKKATVALQYHVNLGSRCILQFSGNQAMSSPQLFDYICRQNGAGLLPIPLLHQEIKKFYVDAGYFDVQIEVNQDNDRCMFMISEGARSKISTVKIKGNDSFDALWLTRRFFSSCAGHYYDQKHINKAVEHLRLYYERHGFISAHITYEVIPSSFSAQELRIVVQEGPHYSIGSVNYTANEVLQERILPSLSGLPFYAERIAQHKQVLLDYLRAQGYLYAHVEPVFSYNDQFVDICWNINVGQKISFGKTILQGPSWLDMGYILPRLAYQEGEPFCMKALEEAVESIRSLQICDTIRIYPDQNMYEQQPILLKLTPDDPFEIRCRFGIAQVSNNFTFRPGTTYAVGGSFIYKNPLGRADQIRFDMDFTRFEHTTAAEYIFPLKTKLPLSGLIKAYDSLYQQPLFPGSDQSLYTIIQRGFLTGINLGYKSLTVGLNYGVEWEKLTNVCEVCACALDFQPSLINVNIPSFIIEPTLLAHYENDRFNPWLSSTTLLSMKGVLPLYTRQASTGFIRFLFEQSGFIHVSPAIVFAARVRVGHVFNQFFRSILPPDRFYLGGAFSVRGYDSDLVPPLSLVQHDNCCVLVPRGGRSMINLNAELRFDVGRYMVLALFQDVGALSSNGWIDMHWVAATGGGIRFKTPIGIVRFDVGFKWKTAKHESCCAWFLTLGNPF